MKITSSTKKSKPQTFPAHFQSRHNKTVVLFFDEFYGIVTETESPSTERVGQFDRWSNCVTSGNWNSVQRTTTFED